MHPDAISLARALADSSLLQRERVRTRAIRRPIRSGARSVGAARRVSRFWVAVRLQTGTGRGPNPVAIV